jgi:hypothetical protein
MKEAPVPPKRRFLQESHGVTTQKTPFFIVTAVKTSNLTQKSPSLRGVHGNIFYDTVQYYNILGELRIS